MDRLHAAEPPFSLAFADMGAESRSMALQDVLSHQSQARRLSLLRKPELLGVEVEAWCVGSGNPIELARYLGPLAIGRLAHLVTESLESGELDIA
ncbi:MAG TPA: hypothetical protein VGF86_03895 [Candidatus Tumulicola sp.]|jgi:hypothetical protein